MSQPIAKSCIVFQRIDCYNEGMKTDAQRFNHRRRHEVIYQYSDGKCCCSCCGEPRLEFLAIDHIDGGGAKHRKELGGGRSAHGGQRFYAWLRKNGYPSGYRVLCHNCNQSIGSFGYCPHQVERGEAVGSIHPDLRPTDISQEAIKAAAWKLWRDGVYPSIKKVIGESGACNPGTVIKHRRLLMESGEWPCQIPQCYTKTTSLTLNKETMSISEWSRRTGILKATLYRRIELGWDDERILTTTTLTRSK